MKTHLTRNKEGKLVRAYPDTVTNISGKDVVTHSGQSKLLQAQALSKEARKNMRYYKHLAGIR